MKPDITEAEPILQEFWKIAKTRYEASFFDRVVELTCVHRTPEEQQALYAKGRTMPGDKVTNIDGVTKKSKHNFSPSRAIDVVVKGRFSGKAFWTRAYYDPLRAILKNEGYEDKITWGGDFKSIEDCPHFEMK